jgi:hypothetical protein
MALAFASPRIARTNERDIGYQASSPKSGHPKDPTNDRVANRPNDSSLASLIGRAGADAGVSMALLVRIVVAYRATRERRSLGRAQPNTVPSVKRFSTDLTMSNEAASSRLDDGRAAVPHSRDGMLDWC